MKIFDFTKWEVLEVYEYEATVYCVQVRMNKRTGFKKFKVSRITGRFHCCRKAIDKDKINSLTPNKQ